MYRSSNVPALFSHAHYVCDSYILFNIYLVCGSLNDYSNLQRCFINVYITHFYWSLHVIYVYKTGIFGANKSKATIV